MKKPSSRIREEIAKLQEALKAAEAREAERIGRIALKAGLGDIEIDEGELLAAFEEIAKRFLAGKGNATGKKDTGAAGSAVVPPSALASGAPQGSGGEA